MSALLVEVSNQQRLLPPAARVLGAITRRVIRGESVPVDEVSVVIGDDELLRSLNARFRRKDQPTDVLSFPGETPGPYRHLGEVVISVDRAVAQAPRYEHEVADELARLLVHGLLHLLGYDHHSPAEGRRMRAAERRHLDASRDWIEKLRHRYRGVSVA